MTSLSFLQWVLPFLAFAVALFAFLVNFRGTIKQFWEGDAATIVLALVALLSMAYGVERYVNIELLDKRLSKIEEHLSTAVGGQLVKSYDEIYESAARICQTTDKELRTLWSGGIPKSPDSFVETVAQRLKERKDHGYAITYDAVLVLDTKKLPDLTLFQRGVEQRRSLYNKYGIGEYVHLYILETDQPISFDILIVDRKHVHFGFTSTKESNRLDNAILFENQPQMASDLATWFDGSVLSKAKPYDEWIKEKQNRNIQK